LIALYLGRYALYLNGLLDKRHQTENTK